MPPLSVFCADWDVCMCACVRACARARVCARVCVRVCVRGACVCTLACVRAHAADTSDLATAERERNAFFAAIS